MFRCVLAWNKDDETAIITVTNFQINTVYFITRPLESNHHLVALAMIYTTPVCCTIMFSSFPPSPRSPFPGSSVPLAHIVDMRMKDYRNGRSELPL